MGVAFLVVFARTRARDTGADDSGELSAAAMCFGVAHPPGYPLWTAGASVVAWGASPRTVVARLSCMSAATAALCLGLFCAFVQRCSGHWFGGFVASLLNASIAAVIMP